MPFRYRAATLPTIANAMMKRSRAENCTTGPAGDNPSAGSAPGSSPGAARNCSNGAMPMATAAPKTAVAARTMERLLMHMRRGSTLLFALFAAAQMHAASAYPPAFRWHTITTEHFYIHYHQGEEDLASRAAVYAENAYARLVPMMGWQPSGRTDVVLADHVDFSNGSASPFPSNRVEIYVTAPGGDPSSPIANYDDWLNLVLTHEYTHILHLDQARGFGRAMRMVFGRNPLLFSFPNLFSPLWFIEGIATVSETENTNAGRLRGTYVDMVLRTAAVEDRWATEAQASGLSPYWPVGGARYYYGSKFLSWLARTRGVDKL